MAELAKVRRVIAKQMPDAPHETLMTVDATTGQNGVRQAKLFGEAVDVDRDHPHQARRDGEGRHRARDRQRARDPGEADRDRRGARGPAPVRRRRLRPRAADRVTAQPTRCDGVYHRLQNDGPLGPLADRGGDPRGRRDRHPGFFLAPFAAARCSRRSPACRRRRVVSLVVFLVVSIVALSRRCGRSPARHLQHAGRSCARAPRRSSGRSATVVERIANDEGIGCVQPRGRDLDRARLRRGRGHRAGRRAYRSSRSGARRRSSSRVEGTAMAAGLIVADRPRAVRVVRRRAGPSASSRRRGPASSSASAATPHARPGADAGRARSSTASGR